MFLSSLRLQSFRNIVSQEFLFHPKFNFIYGQNAQGKTNTIEAIYYVAELKSFRTANRQELIKNDCNFSRIQAQLEKDDLRWNMDITLTHTERKVLLNNKLPSSRKEYHSLIPLVLFEPRHIYLFRDSPSQRRQYLNRAIYLQTSDFLPLMRDYDKVVSQKNKLLKDRADSSCLDVWNDQLVKLGSQIIYLRLCWLKDIQSFLEYEYQQLTRGSLKLNLRYAPCENLFHFSNSSELTLTDIKDLLEKKIKEQSRAEQLRRETLVGPHRDDFFAQLDNRHLGQFGSQGENRSAIIALKLAQLKMYSEKFKRTPLFLLDDVASELDQQRSSYLFSYLRDEPTQVFLTTTDSHVISKEFTGKHHSFLIENGTAKAL